MKLKIIFIFIILLVNTVSSIVYLNESETRTTPVDQPDFHVLDTNLEQIQKINEEIGLLLVEHKIQTDKHINDVNTLYDLFYSTSSDITNSNFDEDEKQKLLSEIFTKYTTQFDTLENEFNSQTMSFNIMYLKYLDEIQLYSNKNLIELGKFEIEFKNKLVETTELDLQNKLTILEDRSNEAEQYVEHSNIISISAATELERLQDRIISLDTISKENTLHEEYDDTNIKNENVENE